MAARGGILSLLLFCILFHSLSSVRIVKSTSPSTSPFFPHHSQSGPLTQLVTIANLFYQNVTALPPIPQNYTQLNATAALITKSAGLCLTAATTIKQILPLTAPPAANLSQFSAIAANQTIPEFLSLWDQYQAATTNQSKDEIVSEFKQQLALLSAQWQVSNQTFEATTEPGLLTIEMKVEDCNSAVRGYVGLCNSYPSLSKIKADVAKDKAYVANCTTPTTCAYWKAVLANDTDILLSRVFCDQTFSDAAQVVNGVDLAFAFLDPVRTEAGAVAGLFEASQKKLYVGQFTSIVFKAMAKAAIAEYRITASDALTLENNLTAA